ncbi:hypothetical protein HYC85_020088 [Camellia sinensis]|uniref:Endoglucanase n=1 Tax=Camellia sinensis TaxID=4442 RepID=A0A7J7GSH1_CAMSI|nr:hypothetical protein HYC85_020088 [Camellia sinensis]
MAESDADMSTIRFVHTVSEAGRLLPSASRWNSIEINFNLLPQSSAPGFDSLPSRFSKSFDFNLVITDRKYFKRFVIIAVAIVLAVTLLVLLLNFLPHKHNHHAYSKNLTLALNQALVFFDAQKSGYLPKNNSVKFRGDSGLHDGNTSSMETDLIGGFYDSGNNIKFSFPTAYTITLLSWTVIEYHQKYEDIEVEGRVENREQTEQTKESERCEAERPSLSVTASDLAGEIVAALSAASLVFKEDTDYSTKLIKSAEELFEIAIGVDQKQKGMYTAILDCGGQATQFYNSTSYQDELVWGGTWLFFATGNTSYLGYATENFFLAEKEELFSEKGIFYWNNKLTANAVLLTRLRFFRDLGYPYEDAFTESMLHGLGYGCRVRYAVTASFLSKLYSDYLELLHRSGSSCSPTYSSAFSRDTLRRFSKSQVDYILGDNPMKTSYVVGFGASYPNQVHHRAASIPWDGQAHSCAEGDKWLNSKEANPNELLGAMVGGPDQNDIFLDEREKPWFTEPSISSNAGLVAALIALHEPPRKLLDSSGSKLGIDQMGMFGNIKLIP